VYEVDEHDRVVLFQDAPQPEVGAPVPALVADESRLELAFIARRAHPSDDESIAVGRFVRPYAHMFGAPNDEAFEGHPLAARGLEPYGVFRIENSSWIRRLERMNSVHDQHDPEAFARLRHYIFAFHDSTFECVATDVDFDVHAAEGPLTLSVDVAP
jgi:hypothetical protein